MEATFILKVYDDHKKTRQGVIQTARDNLNSTVFEKRGKVVYSTTTERFEVYHMTLKCYDDAFGNLCGSAFNGVIFDKNSTFPGDVISYCLSRVRRFKRTQ